MAFGIKYSSSFDVVERPQGITATYSLTFSKEGYTGSIVPLRFFGSNSVVSKISNDSIVGISTKRLDIEILEDIDLSELQIAYPREWKVQFYKTVGSTTTLEFAGWLMPTAAQTNYKDGLKYVRLEASDGLSNLKNFPFVDDSEFYYENIKSIFEIIRLCLLKTGLDLNINTINNTFANGNDTASTAEAMKQRYLDMDLFRGENEPLNTYNVLQDMINTEMCRLYQEDGEWWIENLSEKKTGYVTARKYQSNGTFISGGTLDLRISAVHKSNYQPFDGGISNVMPIKWAKVEHKLGKFKNRLLNRDLNTFSAGSFGNWTTNGITVERVGDGTTGNAYGIKINGFEVEDEDSTEKYIYQTISFPNLDDALNFNLIFKGQAFIKDVDHALIECELTIDLESFEEQGVGYPTATNVFGLSEGGEWVLNGENLILENKDINGFSKKTVKPWDITSKRIGGITFTFGNPTGNRTLLKTGWQKAVTGIFIKIKLKKGVGELEPYPGETKASSVIYKNLSLSWVNADTNLNLKEVHYKATQPDYAPNDETITAIYGDYLDGSNLSTIKDASGNLTSLWTSENSNTLQNFHKHGAMNILRNLGATPKVYDGSIRGLIKYRHSVLMAGITNRAYITSFTYNYGSTEADVRIVEHGIGIVPAIKKTGVLSDGTEISMVDDSPPSPVMGNGVGGGSANGGPFNIYSWIRQLLSGIQDKTNDNKIINVYWGDIEPKDAFDFGSIVRRADKLAIGSADDGNIEIGNKDNQTLVEVLGGKIKVGKNLLYDKSITDGEGDIIKQLGVDSDFQVDGRLEVVGGISLGQDGILITKELGVDGKVFGQIDAENELKLIAPVVNVTNILGINQIIGIDGNPITANAPIYFNQPIYVQPSNNPNSPITNAQFDVALAAYDFGNIRIYSPVRAASNGISTTLFGEQTIDGIALVDGDKFLEKDNADPKLNYIYIVKAGAAWLRVSDLPNNTIKGIQVQVTEGGLINKGGIFVNTNDTEVTVGVTNITFRQSYQNVLNPYAASLAANNQVFQGSNKFDGKLEVRTPLTGTEAANMAFVVDKVAELNAIVTTNYWSKKNNYGIGTSSNNAFELYVNNIKEAQLNAGGRLTGLKGIHINDDVFTAPFASNSYANYYGATIRDNVHVGSLGGTSKILYSLDLVRGSTSGYRAGVRFGSYNAGGGISNFYYGIEYSTSEKLLIGRYLSSTMDGTATSLDVTKSITVNSNGLVGFGVDPTERVDIFGNIKVSGVYKPSGNAPASGNMFLVSDGTTANKYMNFGEFGQFQTHEQFANISALPWGANFVNGTDTDLPNDGLQAHVLKMSIGSEYSEQATYLAIPRPFGNYFDGQIYVRGVYGSVDSGWISVGGGNFRDYDFDEYEATIQYHGYFYNNTPDGREGFIGFNRLDGGVVLEYKYTEIDSNVTTTYRNIMNYDGRLCYQIDNGEAKRYALLEEVGTGGVGVTYTPIEPIYFSGTQIGVRTASASQIGVLTAADWSTFNNKQNTLVKADATHDGYLSKEDWAAFSAGTGGATYTFAEPLYFNGSDINIRTASASQIGVLSSSKFSEFDAKLGQGSTVTSFLNFADDKNLYFGYVDEFTHGARISHNASDATFYLGTQNSNIFMYAYGTGKNITLASSQGYIKFDANRFLFRKGATTDIEIDMSGFATGKVLKATSSTKAEWMTP